VQLMGGAAERAEAGKFNEMLQLDQSHAISYA
jgi:hypothetical protein